MTAIFDNASNRSRSEPLPLPSQSAAQGWFDRGFRAGQRASTGKAFTRGLLWGAGTMALLGVLGVLGVLVVQTIGIL